MREEKHYLKIGILNVPVRDAQIQPNSKLFLEQSNAKLARQHCCQIILSTETQSGHARVAKWQKKQGLFMILLQVYWKRKTKSPKLISRYKVHVKNIKIKKYSFRDRHPWLHIKIIGFTPMYVQFSYLLINPFIRV